MIKLKDILLEGKLTEKYGAQNDGPRLAVGQKIKYRKFNGKVTKVFVKAGQIYYHISYDAGLGLKSAAHFIDPEAPEIQGNKDHPKSPVKRSYIESKLTESFQKRHFLNLIKQEIESLKGQIAYAKDKVRYKGTPDWEKKEFAAILKDKIKDLKDTEKHYKRVQRLKEGKLTEGKVDKSFNKIIGLLRKESRRLNDDDSYELSTKLKAWFNKNIL